MALITLDVPDANHLKVKQIQLTREIEGNKQTLKDVYYEIIETGIKTLQNDKAAK